MRLEGMSNNRQPARDALMKIFTLVGLGVNEIKGTCVIAATKKRQE
jgi:hypothetical protein